VQKVRGCGEQESAKPKVCQFATTECFKAVFTSYRDNCGVNLSIVASFYLVRDISEQLSRVTKIRRRYIHLSNWAISHRSVLSGVRRNRTAPAALLARWMWRSQMRAGLFRIA